jgi:glycosyltransferase involved in cell wall biosynthesis
MFFIKSNIKLIIFKIICSIRTKKLIPAAHGINFLGFHRGDFSLGIALRTAINSIDLVKFPYIVRSLRIKTANTQNFVRSLKLESAKCKYDINLISINPDLLFKLPLHIYPREWLNKFNIGYWFWELPNFPTSWQYALPFIDEIWVSSDFCALAMQSSNVNVIKIPLAVDLPAPNKKFYLPQLDNVANCFKFMFSFDYFSSFKRKNPEAVIRAFQLAFPNKDDLAILIIKSINGDQHPTIHSGLKDLCLDDPRIIFIDENIMPEDMASLLNQIDCYVSLHRSEGFGLGLAEAMLLGKPVIATGFSGNLEFMKPDNSFLVSYDLVPIQKGDYPDCDGQYWAEPDIGMASKFIKNIYQNEQLRAQIGKNARDYIIKYHSKSVMGNAIRERIIQISNSRDLIL